MKTMLLTPRFLFALSLAALNALPSTAEACGGFFCQAVQPVNQAAERIIFANNGDGTVTAVIQILYEGPAERFSWLLPIPTVPEAGDIDISSNVAFQRLQAATNPQYSLTTRVEGTCKPFEFDSAGPNAAAGGSAGTAGASPGPGRGGGVTVEASGTVGAFDWTVISVEQSIADPTVAAVEWLTDNGYDVSPGAPGLIGPYLEDGGHLLAVRLIKGSSVGSIRPLRLTYGAPKPLIPIKLTAVAANADMGVMTWLLGENRGVAESYQTLELNEARINWFNAALTYNDVVTEAANESGGRGFVTEFAARSSAIAKVVWTDFDEAQWTSFRTGTFASARQLYESSSAQYSSWDGFWDTVSAMVTLPSGIGVEDLKLCPSCYDVQLIPSAYVQALEDNVIRPLRETQALIDRSAYVTRLYTTMSAAEMTVDPLFTFNPELPDVSNIHTAERVIECNPDVDQFEAPWRIELPQGNVIRGTGVDAQTGVWPGANLEQPSNSRILQLSDSGPGRVLEDNSTKIQAALDGHNSSIPGSHKSSGCAIAKAKEKGTSTGWALALVAAVLLRARRLRSKR